VADAVTVEGIPALVVPGIGDSGPGHWQTCWERQHLHWRRVRQRDWAHPVCDEWVAALHAAVVQASVPPLLIAHSMGCLTVVHWASRSALPVRAALLVAVPDPEAAMFPATAKGFRPVPSARLPWPSLLVASTDDPFGSAAFARRCAAAWGSEYVEIGAVGHINAESGVGAWPAGLALLQRLLRAT